MDSEWISDNWKSRPFLFGLQEFFYNNQYDDKYQHFRCCDKDFEYDDYGNNNIIYYFSQLNNNADAIRIKDIKKCACSNAI